MGRLPAALALKPGLLTRVELLGLAREAVVDCSTESGLPPVPVLLPVAWLPPFVLASTED